MTFETVSKQQREERASEELVAALDAVTTPMAERILGRAIEVDAARRAEAQNEVDTFDYDELVKIAKEVGVTEEALRQALLEEFNTDKDRNPKLSERITVPDEVRGGVIVAKSRYELTELLEQVMERVREANAEAVEQRDGRTTLVEVRAKTAPIRRRALILIALLVVLGPALAQAVASAIFLGIAIVAVVGVVAWVKRLGRRVRRSVNQALNSLLDDDGESDSWLDVWERSRR